MRMAAATATNPTTFSAIPLAGLVSDSSQVPFPLYLRTADNTWVLYHPANSALDESHVGRLSAEGVHALFIRDQDRQEYFRRVEGRLDQVLLDRNMPLERRADVLYGVATQVADELMQAPSDKLTVTRAQKLMMATSGLLLRENQGFQAVRRVLSVSPGLARHGLTCGFLSMGLARHVLGGDAGTLSMAGLAGLLHDVGRVGHEHIEHDPEHTTRGAAYLRGLERLDVLDAAGAYAWLAPDVATDVRVASLARSDADIDALRLAAANAGATALAALELGGLPPRLFDPKNGHEPAACKRCEVRDACLRGDSGARRRLREFLEHSGDEGDTDGPTAAARAVLALWIPRAAESADEGAEEASS